MAERPIDAAKRTAINSLFSGTPWGPDGGMRVELSHQLMRLPLSALETLELVVKTRAGIHTPESSRSIHHESLG